MDMDRAQTILHSPEKITVLYNKEAVWIHEVDTANNTATIHLENQDDQLQTVEITQLQEV